MDPPWVSLKDEELMRMRICDLDVKIAGSELEPRIARIYAELEGRGLSLRPRCYLGDEWFSPTGAPFIALPFYLAHPRLKALELHQMLEVEGGTPEWCEKLLRHECGHAFDHAYRFSSRRRWHEVFGSPDEEYTPETYRPRPYSRSYVRYLPNWYAQAHPEEDFAETFAVWLAEPREDWQKRYHGWKALEKLEYLDELMKSARRRAPVVTGGRRNSDATRMRTTLARYYAARRKLWAEDAPDFYDPDLRRIFGDGVEGGEPAARFMQRHRKQVVSSIVRWTGQRKYTVNEVARKLTTRCHELKLRAGGDESALLLDLGAFLASLVTNHLHTGKFKRSV